MKDIKLRAWRKNNKEWINPTLFAVVGSGVVLLYRDGRWKTAYEGIEIARFTGLKGKDGKDIYEGDIVSVDVDQMLGGTEEGIGVVQWNDDGNWAIDFPQHGTILLVAAFLDGGFEILGNEWENPDIVD